MNRHAKWAPLALLLPVWLACGEPGPGPSTTGSQETAGAGMPPDVVLVVLDTVRQDHLSCYGYERETSPRLDGLCAEATVYENAWSNSSWTLPSHASLFTGQNPIGHGAHHEHRKLVPEATTLAEVLAAAGYQTIGLISNAMLAKDRQLDQGFAQYHETWRKPYDKHPKLFPEHRSDRRMPWEGVEDPFFVAGMKQLRPGVDANTYFQFRKSLAARDPERPLFLFVNLIGVHSPYNSSGPFYERFLRHPDYEMDENRWPDWYAGRFDQPEDQLEHLVDLYDAEILHVDHVLGRMLDDLRRSPRAKETLLIVTSDHGENLGDHGHLSHVFSLHESATRVPLIVHYPPRFPAGVRLQAPVQLIDIFPTILEAAGVDAAGQVLHGVPLPNADVAGPRPVFLEYYHPVDDLRFLMKLFDGDVPGIDRHRRRLRAVVADDMKLIWGSDGRHELYDLSRDPEEQRNLIDDEAHAATRATLMAELEAFVARHGGDPPLPSGTLEGETAEPELDPETIEQLEELGYL